MLVHCFFWHQNGHSKDKSSSFLSQGFYYRPTVSLWWYCLEDHHPVVLKALQSDPHQGPPQTFREPNRTGIPLSPTTRGLSRWLLSCGRHKVLAPKKMLPLDLLDAWVVGCLAYVIVDLSFYSYCEYRWIIWAPFVQMEEPPSWSWFAKLLFFLCSENDEMKIRKSNCFHEQNVTGTFEVSKMQLMVVWPGQSVFWGEAPCNREEENKGF